MYHRYYVLRAHKSEARIRAGEDRGLDREAGNPSESRTTAVQAYRTRAGPPNRILLYQYKIESPFAQLPPLGASFGRLKGSGKPPGGCACLLPLVGIPVLGF